jgi:hypothetical protein
MSFDAKELKRGMQAAYDLIKDGKAHTFESLSNGLKKAGVKGERGLSRFRRLGRLGRLSKAFDIVIEYNDDNRNKSTVRLVKGSQAKASIKEKAERYSGLVKAHKSAKKSKKKSVKKATKTKSHPHKSTKKAKAKKVAVTPDGSEESAAPSES